MGQKVEQRKEEDIKETEVMNPYIKRQKHTHTHTERERDVGIICVKIYDDLVLEAWTQSTERERE